MQRIGVRDLRQQASRYLKRVQAGDSFEVTDNGRPVARLVPVPSDPWQALIDSGQVTVPGSGTTGPWADETDVRGVLAAPAELAFPLHTEAAGRWFSLALDDGTTVRARRWCPPSKTEVPRRKPVSSPVTWC